MRKLFLLIPALALTLLANAVTPGTKALRAAYNSAEAGSTLVLEAGTYEETERIEFTKSMTIMAAEGAEVIVKTYKDNPLTLGAEVKFIGIKFDGSEMGTREYFIRSYDATAGNELHFENCEVYNFPSTTYLINAASDDRSLDSIIINNCYFHNNGNDAIYVSGAAASKGIIITNSTFANSSASHSIIEVRNGSSDPTEDIELTVNHCTFYNNTFGNGDYSNIRTAKLVKSYISNCIFAHSEAYAKYAAYSYGGTISNCLSYNLTSGYRNWSPCAVFSNNITADPLFNDLANNKYTFAGNWVTMQLSPARGAATDGSDLGDPRWYSAEVLPSVDFASPYQFVGAKAQIAGNLWYDDVNGYLYYNDKSECGVATWKINATRACVLAATLNMNAATTTGHKFKVEVLDAEGNSIAETAEPSSKSDAGNIALPDQIVLPVAGNYTVKLYNLTGWSSAIIDGITFAYVGGDVQAMPGTTNIDDAWFSSNGTRTAGEYISIPAGYQDEGWVKWNVSFAEAANYNVTVNIENENGHNYTVALYTSESDESPITLSEGSQKSTIGTLELGAMEVPAGNYILKVTNAVKWSDAKLISVNFAYAGGAAVDLSKDAPANLLANADAILSDDWTIEGGKIVHPESKALTGWAKWNVNSADYGNYNVTVNISSDNGHLVRVEIFEDENAAPIYTLDETSATQYHTGDQAIDLGNIVLDNSEYVVKVSNTGEYSHVQIASIVISYLNGARATLPASCTFADLMLSEKAQIYSDMLYFEEPGDHNPVGQWAKWNVKVADAGTFLFTMNVTSDNGQSYKISILDGETVVDVFESGSVGTGDKEAKHYFNLAAGNYIVKLENTYSWSQGHVVSLAVTVATDVFVLDESTEDDGSIAAAAETGEQYTFLIKRSFTAGRYYTICLPVSSWDSELKLAFGADYELWAMSSATQAGDEIALNFEQTTSFSAGKPYIIKPSVDVVNPIFYNKKEIKNYTYNNVQEFAAADFVGTFYKDEIPAGESNLYLQNNELFYNESHNTPIKGMRAWIRLKPAGANAAPKARIILNGQVATEINLVDQMPVENQKFIENGQLYILHKGQMYNVQGARVK